MPNSISPRAQFALIGSRTGASTCIAAVCFDLLESGHGGDERFWWQQLGIDPLLSASALWEQTHPALAGRDVRAASEEKCARTDIANGSPFYETNPIAADTP